MARTSTPKFLEAATWVRMAAGKDRVSDYMPTVLTGLSVSGDTVAATDRHRLHIDASGSVAWGDGVWGRNGEKIDGEFPKYRDVVPDVTGHTADLTVSVDTELLAALRAYGKLCCGGALTRWLVRVGNVYVRGDYLADALAGMTTDAEVFYSVTDRGIGPLFLRSGKRSAVIMPVRVPGENPYALDLASFHCVTVATVAMVADAA